MKMYEIVIRVCVDTTYTVEAPNQYVALEYIGDVENGQQNPHVKQVKRGLASSNGDGEVFKITEFTR